jgi:hypothetical protein
MKKTIQKKAVHHKIKKLSRKTKLSKGALGAGTAYVVLALLVIMAAGTMMIGSIVPKSKSPTSGQAVILFPHSLAPSHSNLQLETFQGAPPTLTPIPTTPPQPQSSGGSHYGSGGGSSWSGGGGSGGGGSHSPVGGGGGGGGSSSGGGGGSSAGSAM